MLDSLTATSRSNPHERSIFKHDSQAQSDFLVPHAPTLNVEAKWLPFSVNRDARIRFLASIQFTYVSPYLQTKTSDANQELRNPPLIPLLAQASSLELAEFLRQKVIPKDLSDALLELQHATKEAMEEEFELPSDLALSNAKRLLWKMYVTLPQRFEVYPTPDAEIAIRVLAPRRSVILLCESNGGALCLANLDSGRRRQSYANANDLPDEFLKEALIELKSESG